MKKGKVFLVGAGPGDMNLITIKAKDCIKKADVILYDRLVNPLLLTFAKEQAELIYCGKLPENHTMRQERINELLIEKSIAGRIVVRLKGGDPSVFGRVGEEAKELADYGIPYEIIPGITSSIAAANYAGIPVTHRDFGRSFAVVTGHDAVGKGKLDWEGLARSIDTIAFYMGIANINEICQQLIAHGKHTNTPVAVIEWGTYGRQRTVLGTLATIAKQIREAGITNPAMTLVGEIVSLRKELAWFEKKPLVGRQILLARTGNKPSELASELQILGAEVFEFPTFIAASLLSEPEAREKFLNVPVYEKILFTSPESIAYFFQGLRLYKIDIRMVKAKLFVRSRKSALTLEQYGCFSQIGVPKADERLLVVGAKSSNQLEGSERLVTHKLKINRNSHIIFERLLADHTINTIVFPSARSVELFMEQGNEIGIALLDLMKKTEVICYGVKTASAAMRAGITNYHILDDPSSASLINYLTTCPL